MKIYLILIMCVTIIFGSQNIYADSQTYEWKVVPSYDFQDIDVIDYLDNDSYPVKYGYTANDLYNISIVKNNDKYNVIDYDGNLIFDEFVEKKPDISPTCKNGTFVHDYPKDRYLQYDTFGNFDGRPQITGFALQLLTWNRTRGILGYIEMGDGYIEISFDDLEDKPIIIQEVQDNYNKEYKESYINTVNKFGLINDRKIIVYPKYDSIYNFHEDIAAVRVGEKWGFIDTYGKEIVKPQYDYVGSFVHGYAPVKLNGKAGYIDKAGNNITGLIFDETRPLDIQSGYSWAKQNGKWGVIKINGVEEDKSILQVKSWQEVYLTLLIDNQWIKNNLFSYSGINFLLLDIDKNGTPELIVENNSVEIPESNWCVYIISYDGKKSSIEMLDTYYGGFDGYDEDNKLFRISGKTQNFVNYSDIYELKNNKYIIKLAYSESFIDDKYVCRINGDLVTPVEFENELKKYNFKDYNMYKMDDYYKNYDMDEKGILKIFSEY